MKRLFAVFLFVLISFSLFSQSKTIDKFRKKYPESESLFFYQSTLRMLNNENSEELGELFKDIEKIELLMYKKADFEFTSEEIADLRKDILGEKFSDLMFITQEDNKINLYAKDRRGKTVGFVAIVNGPENLIIMNVKGSLDFNQFLTLKERLDNKL